jgi:hypothetical protein
MTLLSLRDLSMTSLMLDDDDILRNCDLLWPGTLLPLLLAAAMEIANTDCLRSESTGSRLMIMQIANRQTTTDRFLIS